MNRLPFPQDSTGRTLHLGDRVLWRGEVVTIADFVAGINNDRVTFEEIDAVAECWQVDLVSRPPMPTGG